MDKLCFLLLKWVVISFFKVKPFLHQKDNLIGEIGVVEVSIVS